ncbi:MAG: threonine synthase [Pelagibacteraceae bacterium]|nr:threonine synthase [Pelagibacteraceae bacterium]
MEYISTRNKNLQFGFKEIFLQGLAPDGGLFISKNIKKYSNNELNKMAKLNYIDLAKEIVSNFCEKDLHGKELEDIIKKSYSNFSVKNVVNIKKIGKFSLVELFHGPTLAFKDIAMQPIGNIYDEFNKSNNKKINVIVATSGDTGSAAISALNGKANLNVFVLHPDKKISNIQRRLMTTVESKNVFNIALKGNFDDCQKIVKDMFIDQEFRKKINMSGVNSINWARIIFQIVYYFFVGLKFLNKPINFSVPTGNFGDVYSGYVSKKMGLPIKKLIVATNENDILSRVINSGQYKPTKTKPSISPSMDIQVASNFERLLYDVVGQDDNKVKLLMDKLKNEGGYSLNKEELNKIKSDFCSSTVSDELTKQTLKNVYEQYQLLIDPHTATAFKAAELNSSDEEMLILSTAHPCKFSETVHQATGIEPKIPENIKSILNQKESYITLDNNLDVIKNYILERIKEI